MMVLTKRIVAFLLIITFSVPPSVAQKGDSIEQLKSTIQRFYTEGKSDSLLSLVSVAMQRCQETGKTNEYYEIWEKKARQFHFSGLSEQALAESSNMLKQAIAEKNSYGQAIATRSLGLIMTGTGNMAEGEKMIQRALLEFSKDPRHAMQAAYTYIDLIDVQNIEGKYELVLKQCDQLQYILEHSPANLRATYKKEIQLMLGYEAIYRMSALCELKRLDEAYAQYITIQKLLKKYPNELLHQGMLQSLMLYYHASGNNEMALQYIDSVMESYKKNGYADGQAIMLRNKAELLLETKDYPNSAKYYQQYVQQYDSVISAGMSRQIAELNTIYEVNRLTEITHKEKLKFQQTILYVSITISLLLAIIIYLGIITIRRIKGLNRNLSTSEINLKAACLRAEHAAQMRQTFIQNMTHEIRTPLNSIVGFSQVLSSFFEGKPEKEEIQQFTDIIAHNSDLLLQLVGDVLDLSELDSEETLFEKQPTNIRPIFEAITDTLQWRLKPNVAFRLEPIDNTPCYIRTNEQRLQQLLTKLVDNSIKFTKNGTITLAYTIVAENKKYLHISITDTGDGISADKQPYIFDRFMKGNDYVQGTGLGLPICKAIADRLEGKIHLDTNYTEGCRFIILLPLKEEFLTPTSMPYKNSGQ